MNGRWRGPKGRRVNAEKFRPDSSITTRHARPRWRTDWPNSVAVCEDGYVLKIWLGYTPPSQNQFLRQSGHFLERGIRAWAKEVLFAHLLSCSGPGLVPQRAKRKVAYTVYRAKALDDDNKYAGLKPVTDALVDLGLLKDDGPALASIEVVQVSGVPRAERRTEIVITEADDA